MWSKYQLMIVDFYKQLQYTFYPIFNKGKAAR